MILGRYKQGTSISGTPYSSQNTSGYAINIAPQNHDGLIGTTSGYVVSSTAGAMTNGIGRYKIAPNHTALNYYIYVY